MAWGNLPLANPDVANGITHYGYNTLNGGPLTQDRERGHKTEPDKNVYLVFGGKHYLYQGHESGPRGYVTRINLDETDPAKRVTLICDKDAEGNAVPDHRRHHLGPVHPRAPADRRVQGPDRWGVRRPPRRERQPSRRPGGATQRARLRRLRRRAERQGRQRLARRGHRRRRRSGGKVPNSYVYRFVPTDKTDLASGGTLQALQIRRPNGTPVTADAAADEPVGLLHHRPAHLGTSFADPWVTVHTGTGQPFDATAAAKAADATPLKRPENGVFRPAPGSASSTSPRPVTPRSAAPCPAPSAASSASPRPAERGPGPDRHRGGRRPPTPASTTSSFATDRDHLQWSRTPVTASTASGTRWTRGYLYHLAKREDGHADDSGNGAHPDRPLAGRGSGCLRDVRRGWRPVVQRRRQRDHRHPRLGRRPGVGRLLGAKVPDVHSTSWRTFWTQQHGDNMTWEVFWSRH